MALKFEILVNIPATINKQSIIIIVNIIEYFKIIKFSFRDYEYLSADETESGRRIFECIMTIRLVYDRNYDESCNYFALVEKLFIE